MKRMFLMMSSIAAVLLTAAVALAQEEAATGSSPMLIENAWAFALAVAIGIGLAAFGGAFGQARAASAALEGISRNPNASDKVFVPMILGLAFIESLVLFTWVLMFLLLGKF
jgi:F-type H+-transporting ATPase subunit c